MIRPPPTHTHTIPNLRQHKRSSRGHCCQSFEQRKSVTLRLHYKSHGACQCNIRALCARRVTTTHTDSVFKINTSRKMLHKVTFNSGVPQDKGGTLVRKGSVHGKNATPLRQRTLTCKTITESGLPFHPSSVHHIYYLGLCKEQSVFRK
jgi:hypothetical protein